MSLNIKKYEIKAEALRWNCPHELVEEEIDPEILASPIIGQDRALKALRMGLDIKQAGFHIFVTGFPGTGRHTAVRYLLEKKLAELKTPPDWCYVWNFKDPAKPISLSFPAGKSQEFKKDIEDLIEYLKKKIANLFAGEFYAQKSREIMTDFKERKSSRLKKFENQLVNNNFSLEEIQTGAYSRFVLTSSSDGTTVAVADLDDNNHANALVPTSVLPEKQAAFVNQLAEILQKMRMEEQDMHTRIRLLDQELVLPLFLHSFENLKKKYFDPKLAAYLEDLKNDILNNLPLFQKNSDNTRLTDSKTLRNIFPKYQVNIVQNNHEINKPPVVFEESPTLNNLFGTIEKENHRENKSQTTYLNIRPGSLMKANGGYLIINLSNISNLMAFWHRLRQVLKSKELIFESNNLNVESPLSSLRPEPIPLDVQVILIGEDMHYYSLYEHDSDFINIFKIRADFDTITTKTSHVIRQYVAYLTKLGREEKLLPFHATGIARIIEEAVRMAGWRLKISAELSLVADLVREANYWAETENAPAIDKSHVEIALNEKKARLNLIEERVRERMLEGFTMINLAGSEVGQINGLVIREDAEHQFSKPNRLTVRSSMGRSGIVNIERDSDFSGRSHTKGVSILKGYFRSLYAQDKELNFTASICFEQSYSRIDGDSASAAEVLALISSLGHVPIRQDIAVTGSINQIGEIQPIGGVNEKIEGFFDLCREVGLTGMQGVIIPARNSSDLQLNPEVVAAVRNGKFHIYVIHTINEGLEILTGLKAGEANDDGFFPKGTVHYFVDERLREMNRKNKEHED